MNTLFRFALLIIFVTLGFNLVSANHSFSVSSPRICLNGANFVGTSTESDSRNLLMIAQIFDDSFALIATGSNYTFGDSQVNNFIVSYSEDTLNVGDTVYYSVSDIAGTLNGAQGAFEAAVVQNCLLDAYAKPLDSRINRYDAAAPIAVYPNSSGGVDIYRIVDSEGIFIFGVSTDDFADAANSDGNFIAGSQEGIVVILLEDGTYQIVAPTSDGKTYYLYFEAISSNSLYSSYTQP